MTICGVVESNMVEFLNILDRGYHAKLAALSQGKQLALQPPPSKSDQRFKGRKQCMQQLLPMIGMGMNEQLTGFRVSRSTLELLLTSVYNLLYHT